MGRDHQIKFSNGHDAYALSPYSWGTVGVVCDGCGSGAHSEVGAKIAARIIPKIIDEQMLERLRNDRDGGDGFTAPLSDAFWKIVHFGTLDRIKRVAYQMCDMHDEQKVRDILFDYFLFTVVGFLHIGDNIWFFSVGDGVILINGELQDLGDFPGNRPPYMAYAATAAKQKTFKKEDLDFRVQRRLSREVDTFLVGSDGVEHLIDNHPVPGKDDVTVIDFLGIETDRKNYLNPAILSRKLQLLNGGILRHNCEEGKLWKWNGLLPDDTTMIIGEKTVGDIDG